jgi:hypothetical protein
MKTGKLTISRVTSNEREAYICIALRDERYKPVLEIEVDLESFARTVTGQGCVDCQFDARKQEG